jgi:hypothetical protein
VAGEKNEKKDPMADLASMGGAMALLPMLGGVRRDVFAAQAMQALIIAYTAEAETEDGTTEVLHPDAVEIAEIAVEYADALVKRLARGPS